MAETVPPVVALLSITTMVVSSLLEIEWFELMADDMVSNGAEECLGMRGGRETEFLVSYCLI